MTGIEPIHPPTPSEKAAVIEAYRRAAMRKTEEAKAAAQQAPHPSPSSEKNKT